jgi:oxalate decarboxylase/phosphoglucose isomerase-like protein (cupin superfamily)
MSHIMNGIVTIVQESRFHMTDNDGVSHLFILGHAASAEPQQLASLQARQAHVRVRYKPASGLIGNIATAIYVDG